MENMEIMSIKGGWGFRRLMANAILNFHFDFPGTSLMEKIILNFHFDYLTDLPLSEFVIEWVTSVANDGTWVR